MLKNLRVGTKLVAILIPPIVVLAVLAALGVRDRLELARAGDRARDLSVLAGATADTAHLVGLEQLWSSAILGSDGATGTERYQEISARTDAAIAQLNGAVGAVGELPGVSDRRLVLTERLDSLARLRQDTLTNSIDAGDAQDRYGLVVVALDGLNQVIGPQDVNADVVADLGQAALLLSAKQSVVDANARIAANPTSSAGLTDETMDAITTDQGRADRRYLTFFELADTEFKALLRNEQSSSVSRQNVALLAAAMEGEAVDVNELLGSAEERIAGDLRVQAEIVEHTVEEAAEERSAAVNAMWGYIAGALAAILAAMGLAFLVARSVVRPLHQLTQSANELSDVRLPALVQRLRTPGAGGSLIEPQLMEVRGRDEISELAGAFNQIQRVTVEVAEEQAALLRKGISDLFINLARRNQTLLDRQIAFIDDLERTEPNPDQLENLFRLDHLATRMRRNAESLLVLAGSDPPRRRGQAVSITDVVRVAIGEVEEYTRIDLTSLEDASVSARVSVDLSHLIAELMDNAAQFSSPEARIEVAGEFQGPDRYVLAVTDSGIGMTDEQLDEANRLLASPPITGLALGRSLGLIVVGRLAQRHGVDVRLASVASGGLTAQVMLPAAILASANAAIPSSGVTRAYQLDQATQATEHDASGPEVTASSNGHLILADEHGAESNGFAEPYDITVATDEITVADELAPSEDVASDTDSVEPALDSVEAVDRNGVAQDLTGAGLPRRTGTVPAETAAPLATASALAAEEQNGSTDHQHSVNGVVVADPSEASVDAARMDIGRKAFVQAASGLFSMRAAPMGRLIPRIGSDGGASFTYRDADERGDNYRSSPSVDAHRQPHHVSESTPQPNPESTVDPISEVLSSSIDLVDDEPTPNWPPSPPTLDELDAEAAVDAAAMSIDLSDGNGAAIVDQNLALPRRRDTSTGSSGSGSARAEPRIAPTTRSPEEVRQMLSRYRTGLNRGRVTAQVDEEDSARIAEEHTNGRAEDS